MAESREHDNLDTADVLRPIEGNYRWDGTLRFNIVDVTRPDEIDTFNAIAEQPPMTQDFPREFEDDIERALTMLAEFIDLNIDLSNRVTSVDYWIGDDTTGESLGYTYTPGPLDYLPVMAISISDPLHNIDAELGGSNERFQTIIHEFGHTLGLEHPHDAFGGTIAGEGTDAFGDLNEVPYQWHHTMMSYTRAPGVGFDDHDFGSSVTPMALDIAALHNMYGPNMATRTGNTVYRLTDPRTEALDMVSDDDGLISVGRAYYGIWDAGVGDTDTILYEGDSDAVVSLIPATLDTERAPDAVSEVIGALEDTARFNQLGRLFQLEWTDPRDLSAGMFSSVLDGEGERHAGGYSIAAGVVVEQATTGAGDDLLVGNEADNTLDGNAGNDLALGAGGADTLIGGAGADTLMGGAGADYAFGGGGDDLLSGGDALDTVDYGSAGLQVIVNLALQVSEGLYADVAAGRASADPATAGFLGEDVLSGFENATGGMGNDVLRGTNGDNVLMGGDGNDILFGRSGGDNVQGEAGNDMLRGGNDDDVVDGGAGADTVEGQSGDDTLFGGEGSDLLLGQIGEDLLVGGPGFDTLDGGIRADTLEGDAGADDLDGNFGNDRLNGGAGNDRLFGNLGLDTLTGGEGFDIFVFNPTAADVITDFEPGVDTIVLGGLGVTSLSDLRAIAQQGPDVLLVGLQGQAVTLLDTDLADLSASDFDPTGIFL